MKALLRKIMFNNKIRKSEFGHKTFTSIREGIDTKNMQ